MPDVRTLLDDATRRTPHPDPVGAVRATVRRRAARRRAVVAAGTAAVVAGAGSVVATTRREPAGVTAKPPGLPARPVWDGITLPDQDTFVAYLWDNHDRFAFLGLRGDNPDDDYAVWIGIGSDADEAALRAEIEAVAGDLRWRFVRCGRPLAEYRAAIPEVAAARWPSGAKLAGAPELGSPDALPCAVRAEMPYIGDREEDVAYARDRWGDRVAVVGRSRVLGAGRPVVRPPGGADRTDPGFIALTALVTENPAAFVGLYVDGNARAVVVLGGGVSVYDWEHRVREAARGLAYSIEQCTVTYAELKAVQDALPEFDYPSGRRPAFGSYTHPATCSVRMETGPLPPEDRAALVREFGDRLTIDESGAPRRD